MQSLIINPNRLITSAGLALTTLCVLFLPTGLATAAHCTPPYVNVQGAGTAALNSELTIQSVNIGEPFDGNCSHKSITFVEKVVTLDPGNTGQVTPIYNGVWTVRFSTLDTAGTPRTLFVVWHTETVPTGTFSYGFVDTSTAGQTVNRTFICAPPATNPCPVSGTVAANGTITITLDTSAPLTFAPQTGPTFTVNLGNPGTNLTSVQGVTYLCACAGGSGAVSTQSQTAGNGSYTLSGNLSCSAPPVAALSASTNNGPAPLTVNFDASGSNIPAGGCGTINSYIFDFGDSTGVTQPTPTTSHTYTTGGVTYPARVRVTNTAGLTSSNIAEQDITVTTVGPPVLVSVGSRATHGNAGDFDVNLNLPPNSPSNPRGVECRSTGGNYKVVFSFLNNLVAVGSPSVTTGTFGTVSGALGPNANQYTVNLTGVANVQYVGITLLAAQDSTGALGNEPEVQMGVLIGDATGNGIVSNSGDVNSVKSQVSLAVTLSNFRNDINANGVISNSGDVAITKAQVSTQLNPLP